MGKNFRQRFDAGVSILFDGIGEMADVACGDAWYLTESGQADFSEHAGRNVILREQRKDLS